MWTLEEEKQLSESWKRAQEKRRQEAESDRFRLSRIPTHLEMPPENSTPSYPYTGAAEESSLAMLRRANSGTCDSQSREEPLTEADLGMTKRAFDELSPARQLAIANAVFFRRNSSK